jgi:tyrosyl-tRNA synthetase
MSFTEFTYQLIQGYDFIIYIKNTIAYCKWEDLINGNITTGTELVRRMNVGEEAKSVCDDLSTDYKSRWF